MKLLIIIIAAIFVASLAGYIFVISDGTVRTVEFIVIFAIGVLGGVLLSKMWQLLKSKERV